MCKKSRNYFMNSLGSVTAACSETVVIGRQFSDAIGKKAEGFSPVTNVPENGLNVEESSMGLAGNTRK
jgi:hypothetical protein